MTRIRSVIALAVALLLSACTTAQRAAIDPNAVYVDAIYKSAVYEHEHVRELRPLVATDGAVLVVSMRTVALPKGKLTIAGDMWVTGVPEVRERCSAFTGNVVERLHELLGLPPATAGEPAFFSTMRVHANDLFRPAPDPRIDTRFPCDDESSDTCGNVFPDNATLEHRAWIARSMLGLHRWPGGYPWTHLGYTYDWGGKGESAYGASEYIVRGGSQVEVVDAVSYTDYCKR